jgi:hypothetical protein
MTAQLLHNHCAITTQSLRNREEIVAEALQITAQSLRNNIYFSITAQSL